MLGIESWTSAALLASSLAVTLLADWLVARRQRRPLSPTRGAPRRLDDWLGRLVWVALLFVGLAITIRYLERVENPLPGYALLALVALLVSVARAVLYRRAALRDEQLEAREPPGWRHLLHGSVYALTALALLLVLVWLAGQRLHWSALVALLLGVLLPDLDDQASLIGRAFPFLSRPLQAAAGRGEIWQTPATAVGLVLLALPLLALGGWQAWIALPLGFAAHLLIDLFGSRGIMLLWPLRSTHYRLLNGPLSERGGRAERWLATLLALGVVLLTVAVGVGAEPPPPIAAPSYEQTLERYYAQRGRTLVYASVQGSWQTSGRRIAGTFEVLNAVGSSFILLDRYAGQVFAAGRTAEDNLYVNSISLQFGEAVSIKPIEIRLSNESLASALPVLYEMQAEPGLQHTYISGDLLLAPGSPGIPVDYSQTALRRMRKVNPGHYSLRYVTAAELIGLAHVQVDSAELLVVSTYTMPASGPTVTPLPSPAPSGAGGS